MNLPDERKIPSGSFPGDSGALSYFCRSVHCFAYRRVRFAPSKKSPCPWWQAGGGDGDGSTSGIRGVARERMRLLPDRRECDGFSWRIVRLRRAQNNIHRQGTKGAGTHPRGQGARKRNQEGTRQDGSPGRGGVGRTGQGGGRPGVFAQTAHGIGNGTAGRGGREDASAGSRLRNRRRGPFHSWNSFCSFATKLSPGDLWTPGFFACDPVSTSFRPQAIPHSSGYRRFISTCAMRS